jgi:hypothetical protein
MADYSDIISQYGGTPASDYSDIISQFGGVPEEKKASPVFEKPFFGVAPKTGEEAISNILDIGALMAGGAGLAARQYAKPVIEGRPLAPLAPIAEAAKGAVTLPILAGQAAFGDKNAMRLTGEYGGRLLSLPANVMASYGEAYGSPEAAFRTAALQPGRFATDIMGVPSLVGGAAQLSGRALTRYKIDWRRLRLPPLRRTSARRMSAASLFRARPVCQHPLLLKQQRRAA